MPRAAIAWSAGKDSCLALHLAREAGWQIERFITFCNAEGASLSHGLPSALVAEQVGALGGKSLCLSVGEGGYAAAFDQALNGLVRGDIGAMVFGDIDLQAHRDWIEAACARHGIEPLFPLWARERAWVAQEVIARGLRARVVSVDASLLVAEACGREYDSQWIAALPAGVCPAGEDGEFHTFVHATPFMDLRLGPGRLRTLAAEPPLRPRPRHVIEFAAGDWTPGEAA